MHANQILDPIFHQALDPIFHQALDPCLNTPEWSEQIEFSTENNQSEKKKIKRGNK